MPGRTTLTFTAHGTAPRHRHRPRDGAPVRARAMGGVLALALATAVPLVALPFAVTPLSPAHAQNPLDQATQDLFVAVDANDLDAVKAAIQNGADIGATDFNGMQPVDLAIDRGYFDIAHFLISVRNQMDAQAQGATPAPAPSAAELAAQANGAPDAVGPSDSSAPDPFATDSAEDTASAPDPFASDAPPPATDSAEDASPFPQPPTPPELAPSDTALPEPSAMDGTTAEPTDDAQSAPADDTPNPFDAPTAGNDLEVLGDVRAPEVREPNDAAPEPTLAEPTEADTPSPGTTAPDALASTESAADGPDVQLDASSAEGAAPAASATAQTEEKPSATKRFITTFFDFFKPPNTTGIVRKGARLDGQREDAVTDEDISRQIEELQKEAGTRAITESTAPIAPGDAGSADTQATPAAPNLPPYSVAPPNATPQTPQISSDVAFGNMQVEEASPEPETSTEAPPQTAAWPSSPASRAPQDSTRPFGGGVDPDILALLGMDGGSDQSAPQDPFASATDDSAPQDPFASDAPQTPADPFASDGAESAADPFAAPAAKDGGDSVSTILEDIDRAENVTELQTRKPPPPEADPFADSGGGDPFAAPDGEVDELAGLLESTGEEVSSTSDGWDVKEVEGGNLPDDAPVLASIEPSGEALDGVELTLGMDTAIGQPVGEERLQMLDLETIHKPCITKGGPETVYCVDKISWPFALEEDFLVDTIMYQGTRAIARYDAGRATRFHSLFKTDSMAKVVKFYTDRYGPPTDVVERAIAPLAQPRRDNPTFIWRSREPGTDTMIILEVRKFDDALSGFPDTKRGAILLYREHAGSIFPQLSQLELMVLKDSAVESFDPKTPDSVW